MGSEGQQDVEMAILTALLKGEPLGRGDSDFCLSELPGKGFANNECSFASLLLRTFRKRTLSRPGCLG